MNGGILLLRFLLMYMVVVHHAISHTQFATASCAFPLFLLTVPAVDCFVSITGWFGARFSWRKYGLIAGQIVYYSMLSVGCSFLLAGLGWIEKPIVTIGNAWFGTAYLALLCLSPLLNGGLEMITGKGHWLQFVIPWALVWGVDYIGRGIYQLYGFGSGFCVSGFGSHTFATFVCVYCLMWIIRRKLVPQASRAVIGIGLSALVIYGVTFMLMRTFGTRTNCVDVVEGFGFYNSPFVILIAVAVVTLFASIKIPSRVVRVLSLLSPSVFAVYLMTDTSPIGKQLLMIGPISRMDSVLSVLLWSLAVFAVCLVLDVLVRRVPLALLRRLWRHYE